MLCSADYNKINKLKTNKLPPPHVTVHSPTA